MGSDEPQEDAGGEDAATASDEPGEESSASEPEPEQEDTGGDAPSEPELGAEETGGDAPSSDVDESAAAAAAAPARKLSAPMGGSPWTANEWPPAHCPGRGVQVDPRSDPG